MGMRIVLADDTILFRDGLKLVLELQGDITVVGEAGDGAAAVALVEQERPDLILMDIQMPVMDGVEATRRIRAQHPGTQVLVLTTYFEDAYITEALAAGAAGYLLKDMHARHLIHALRAVLEGGVLILPPVAARLLADYARLTEGEFGARLETDNEPDRARVADLTPRETDVLRLVAQGCSNREIAQQLYLTEGTVKNHLSAIYSKLHARDRAQAISLALRQGLVN